MLIDRRNRGLNVMDSEKKTPPLRSLLTVYLHPKDDGEHWAPLKYTLLRTSLMSDVSQLKKVPVARTWRNTNAKFDFV